jgi:hypothetical protein
MIAIWNQLLNANSAVDRAQILSLVARNIVLPMSARELNVVQLNEARTTIFAASLLLAAVVARAVETLARLWTLEDLVHALGVTPRLASVATLSQALITRKLASAFGAESFEVNRLKGLHLSVHMARAAEAEGPANRVRRP